MGAEPRANMLGFQYGNTSRPNAMRPARIVVVAPASSTGLIPMLDG